ncbi:MAG TPA: discoidin domain-containing protein [Oscillospiraceae bacterium]|nr:discoidin domain-containing protein [Oscillospiraceae bacterium]
MKKQNSGMMHAGIKKATSLFLAVTLIATSAINVPVNVHASDTLPYLGDSARGTNQAYGHGYRTVDLKNWTPETDPYSQFMRARIPLQTRNGAFSGTQANPKLNSQTQMFTLAGDYGNAFFDSYQYTNEFSQYLFNYWQYTDYYGSWHGMPTEDVPESMYVSERGVTDAWKNRKFEFGVINMPNPGYTNAAHKNGVKSIGCIFLPRTGQSHAALMTQDAQGKYPYADQLAKMCKWYGFDGYFINQEEGIPSTDIPKYKEFMKQMRDQGIYIQWYDSVTSPDGGVSYQNQFNDSNSSFVKDTKLGQVSDSIFLNYWWSKDMLTNSANHAKSLSLNPLTTVFAGIEAGGDRWNQPYDLRNNLDENGQPMNAIASLGSEFVHDGLDEDLDGGANNNIEMRREKDDYQWMTFQRERMWWTGMTQDPTTTQDKRRDASYANAGIGVNTGDKWDGVSAYIAERSVIKGDTFATNFNTGHGLEYVNNGTVSNSHEWSNIVIQDNLPTWQWWQETTGTKMTVDFDYGTKYKKTLADKTAGKFNYDLVGAYNGGSSLVVSGKLDADNFLHLYKTNLDVKNTSKMDITFKKTSSDTAAMKLGVIFADDPTKVVKLDIANTTAKSDSWVTSSVDLSTYAGKKIAAYGLAFTGTSDKYQINIGQMKYTSNAAVKPAAPTNFKIAKAYSTSEKEMTLTWDIASYDDVKQYNVYAVINGKEMYMGGTYDSTFYIKSLYDAAGPVTIKLKAVSADGTESDAATATYDYSKTVSNVTVTPTETSLDVTFTAPAGVTLGTTDVSVVKEYSADTSTTFSATSANSAATVSVPVSVKDGSRYTMKLTPKDASGNTLETVTYDGKFIDKTADSYTGKVIDGHLTMPESKDWNKMYVTPVTDGVDGDQQTVTRAVDAMPSIDTTVDSVKVVLEDYAGNKSSVVTVPNIMAVSITPSSATVQVSKTQQFTAKVKNYVSDSTVSWSVKGAKSAATTMQDGLLTIGTDETTSSIQVVATSKEDPSVTATADVTVIPAVAISPSTSSVYKGETQQFSILNLGVTQQASDYNWTVSGKWGSKLQAGTTITQDGLLTVDPNESDNGVTVTATNKANSSLVYKASVDVKSALAISTTSYDSYVGEDVTLQVSYKGTDGAVTDYNWKVESGTNGVTKSGNTTITDGVLKIGPDEKASMLTVTATKKDNANITATYTCYPSNPIDISGSSSVMQGENATFTASYKYNPADSTMITWKVEDAKSANTKINADGVLSVAADETAVSVTVRAISKENPLISSTKTVTINVKPGIPEGCVSANTTVLGASGNGNAGETVDKALDADETTKWCVSSAKTGWLAIDLGKEYSINRWRTVQGEKGDGAPGFNTPKFALEVLKDKNATAVNLKDAAYLANKDNWTEVQFVDNSKDLKMVVDNTLANPVIGRYFRLRIDDSTSNQYTAIRIHEFQLYGQAAIAKYNVKVLAATNGTVTADKTAAAAGEKITLTVKPNDGYAVDSVKMNDTAIALENGVYSFTMPAAEAAVAVAFKAVSLTQHAITVSAAANGTVTADKASAAAGEVVTLAVKPNNGYALDTVKLNGVTLQAVNGTYSFVMPDGEVTVTTAFKVLKYNIKAAAAANGSVTPDKASAAAGEKVALTVKADTGYAVDTVKVNGTSVTPVNNVYSFVMPAADAEITATFKSTAPAITPKLAETTQGVSLEGQNGVTFDKNTKLVAQESKKVIPEANGQKGIKLFDISLILNGSKIEPNGKVKVTIKLPAECAKYKNLGIVYLDDNNVAHPIQSTVNGDMISFVAEHFSLYGIVGTPASSTTTPVNTTPVNTVPVNTTANNTSTRSPETGDNSTPILPVILALAACVGLVYARKKRISIHQ